MREGIERVLDEAVASLTGLAGRRRPKVGVVLGSGLGGVIDAAADVEEVHYSQIPGFAVSGVKGHVGSLAFARVGGVESVVMRGRVHLYEGHEPHVVVHPVRTLIRLGVEALVLTNAAGGLAPKLCAGDIMGISDHINLTGTSPLAGPNIDNLGPRFPVMAGAYDEDLRAHARAVAQREGIPYAEGVYAGVLGPAFETPAEVAALTRLGADAVGMSTVFETIAARHAGVRVVALSLITNTAGAHDDGGHEAVLAAGEAGAARMATLVTALVSVACEAT
ncbi:MAG: purine-nucleoside phosphorylase [Clostridiales bacterium]|nr:purine-nucleoside phosphorylase [Clostridiales bacterium]